MKIPSIVKSFALGIAKDKYKNAVEKSFNQLENNSTASIVQDLKNDGLDNIFIENMYERFKGSSVAKQIQTLTGKTAEDIRDEARNLFNIQTNAGSSQNTSAPTFKKFPRL